MNEKLDELADYTEQAACAFCKKHFGRISVGDPCVGAGFVCQECYDRAVERLRGGRGLSGPPLDVFDWPAADWPSLSRKRAEKLEARVNDTWRNGLESADVAESDTGTYLRVVLKPGAEAVSSDFAALRGHEWAVSIVGDHHEILVYDRSDPLYRAWRGARGPCRAASRVLRRLARRYGEADGT